MNVKLISVTPEAEKLVMYCARVSSSNQSSENPRLLYYCLKNKHWSIFEQASATFEVKTSRAIAAQILRHKSMNFQELSQRYAEAQTFEIYDARRQDDKNRQNSIDDMSEEDRGWFEDAQMKIIHLSKQLYDEALSRSIAKEQARILLPLSTATKMYVTGSIRSWITYLMVRLDKSTQLEHREIAQEIWKLLKNECPHISKALTELHPDIFV